MLKLEGLGLSQTEIVKQLSQNAKCSERTIYNDIETRGIWQPTLQGLTRPEDVVLKAVNRNDQIYRQASIRVLSSSNELAQLGALNIMLKANSKHLEMAVLPEMLSRLKALEDKARKGVFVK